MVLGQLLLGLLLRPYCPRRPRGPLDVGPPEDSARRLVTHQRVGPVLRLNLLRRVLEPPVGTVLHAGVELLKHEDLQ